MSPLEKAAMEAYRAYDCSRQAEWAGLGPTNQRRYKDIARAVLLAVREPGWEVISAGAKKDLPGLAAGCLPHWTAMIDAILEGE